MDKYYYIGLGLSTLTSIIFVFSLFKKDKEEMLKLQFIETMINIVKNFLLGGLSGSIVQCFGLIRNYLGYRNINNPKLFYTIILGQIVIGSFINNHGLVGLLPIVASVSYTYTIMKTKNPQVLRYALTFNLSLWLIYEIILKDYPSLISGVLLIIFNLVAILKNKKG